MSAEKTVSFGPFRLDAASERLWRGSQAIALRPKAFAVLTHLLQRPGELVTKQQLLDAVWPATFVTDAVLKDSIKQLRNALNDDPSSPRYIETAHRRGYRFIAPIADIAGPRTIATAAASAALTGVAVPSPVPAPPLSADGGGGSSRAASVLGRDHELARIRRCLHQAVEGQRQVLFVTGEAGIGKTTVVSSFVDWAAAQGIAVARGQCLEHFGAGEAYLPLLDAISRLGRGYAGGRVVSLLREHAPAWLRELPSLLPAADRQALQQEVMGATRERMLREMGNALDAMAADQPLIVVLEDLHWSDYSTIDLIGYLARRRDPARLLVIGTYRPVDVILKDHPLKGVKRELQAHGLCHEIALGYLAEDAIAQHLADRFPGHRFPGRLARLLHRRTEGNPLFMVNVVQHLVDEGGIIERDDGWAVQDGFEAIESEIPDNIRHLIERQVDRLSPDERKVLAGASVVGMDCSSVAIAAGLDESTSWVEDHCEALARRHQFLGPARLVTLPDGTVTARYRFSHVLYLEVPYGLIPPMERAAIHGRIGARGESIYGDRVHEIAAELAMHFEQGRDPHRAVKYLLMAAENAVQRSAHHEAASLSRRGLAVLTMVTETTERIEQELRLRTILGLSLMATRGYAVAQVEEVYRPALALCARLPSSYHTFVIQWLWGLFQYFGAELDSAQRIAADLLSTASELGDPVCIVEAHRACGVCLVDAGRFSDALAHFDRVAERYDTRRNHGESFAGHDPMVVSDCFAARALWVLGYPDQALERAERGLSLARQLSHPQSLVVAAHFAAHVHGLRGDDTAMRQRADEAIALADEYGLAMWLALARLHHTPTDPADAAHAVDELRRGVSAYEAIGGKLWRAHALGVLAEMLANANQIDEGLTTIDRALESAREMAEGYALAELHRVRGELLVRQADAASEPDLLREAKDCFTRSLEIARGQMARSWELRTATSLARLQRRLGQRDGGRRLLQTVHARFTEGHATSDLRSARALIDELRSR